MEALSENSTTASLTEEWSQLSKSILEAAAETLGYTTRKHQDWFDDNNKEIRELLKAKNDAHSASLRSPGCTELRNKWKSLRNHVQKELRLMENSWWIEKASEIQQYADSNDTPNFYNAIKAVYGPSHHSVHPVRSKDGSTLFKDRKDILSRWAEHLRELLNCVN